jgi:hypothetical protein
MAGLKEQRARHAYTNRRLAGIAYRKGFRERSVFWRAFWYGLMVMRFIQWLRPSPELLAREVLQPGESVTIFATKEKVGKRRR